MGDDVQLSCGPGSPRKHTLELDTTTEINTKKLKVEYENDSDCKDRSDDSDDGQREDEAMPETDQSINSSDAVPKLDPLSYTKTNEFTSEIFKIQIYNLPTFGFSDLKKRLKSTLGLNPHKIKHISNTLVTYVCFRNEADRDKALRRVNGHRWKGKVLEAKIAAPMADPYLQKRLQAQEAKSSQQTDSAPSIESLTPEEAEARLKANICPLWNTDYSQQLQIKVEKMKTVLEGISKHDFIKHLFEDRSKKKGMCELLPIIPSPVITEYRNKNEFSIGFGLDGKTKMVGFRYGLYKDGCTAIGDCTNLGIAMPAAIPVVKSFTEFIRKSKWEPYVQHSGTGHWHTLTVRTYLTGDVMAMVDFQPRSLNEEEIEAAQYSLKEFYTQGEGRDVSITSLYFRVLGGKGIRDQTKLQHLCGQTHVHESLMQLKFRISAEAFFQVNTPATEKLYELIAEWANVSPSTTVLDICCGTGTIGLSLANKVMSVIGIEMSYPAIQDAKANARINGITNAVFHCAKVEDIINKTINSLSSPQYQDVVAIVDPPRAGLHKDVIKCLRRCEAIQYLIYVSCNPASAKNNFVDLLRPETGRHKGLPFIMDKVRPVDLFPGTKHCELVVLFKREETTASTNNPEVMAREDTATGSTQGVPEEDTATGSTQGVPEEDTVTGSTQGVPESAAVLPGEPNLSL